MLQTYYKLYMYICYIHIYIYIQYILCVYIYLFHILSDLHPIMCACVRKLMEDYSIDF